MFKIPFLIITAIFIIKPFIGAVCINDFNNNIETGLNYVYNEKYYAADSVFTIITTTQPEMPYGYFFKAFTYYFQYIDYCSNVNIDKFEINISLTEKYSENCSSEDEKLFFKGGSVFLKGGILASQGKFMKAYDTIGESINLFDKISKQFLYYYDSRFAKFSWEFYIAEKIPFINSLFFGYDKEEAVTGLKTVSENGILFSLMAKNMLFEITLMDENSISEQVFSKKYLTEIEKSIPNTRLMKWINGKYYFHYKEYDKAIPYFKNLLQNIIELYAEKNIKSKSNLAEIYNTLAKCYFSLYKFNSAKEYALLTLRTEFQNNESDKEDEYKDQAKEILRQINDILSKN